MIRKKYVTVLWNAVGNCLFLEEKDFTKDSEVHISEHSLTRDLRGDIIVNVAQGQIESW
jgi:hypothetical protein